IRLRTIIAWPSPTKQDTGAAHGAKLGDDEVAGLKEALGLDPATTFDVPDDVLQHTRALRERGAAARTEWQQRFDAWRKANHDRARLFDRLRAGELPQDWADALPVFDAGQEMATRAASGKILGAL